MQNVEPSGVKSSYSLDLIFPATAPKSRSIPISWHLEEMDGERAGSTIDYIKIFPFPFVDSGAHSLLLVLVVKISSSITGHTILFHAIGV